MKTKLLSILLIVVMCLLSFAACGEDDSLTKITVNVKVTADGRDIIDDVFSIEYDPNDDYVPTVLDAVIKACEECEFKYTLWSNGNSFESISGDTIDTYANNDTMWWRWTLNGVEPEEGTANDHAIKNNDVIVFSYEEQNFEIEE